MGHTYYAKPHTINRPYKCRICGTCDPAECNSCRECEREYDSRELNRARQLTMARAIAGEFGMRGTSF